MPDPIARWQIVSPDPEQTVRFYERLFGWKSTQANAMGYRELRTEVAPEGPVDGGVWPAPPGQGPMVQLYVEVNDVKAYADKATKAGARIVVPPSVLPDGDEMAVLLDPMGMSFGICRLMRDATGRSK